MDTIILGIETSCDETAAAVVRNGREILSSVVLSQIEDHAAFGGVVPEVASRRHLETIVPVVGEAMKKSGAAPDEIDAVAATYGPGLVGALLVGLTFAKGFAKARGIPFIGVHHIAAHILAASLSDNPPEPPFTALVVSGGHSGIYHVKSFREFILAGRTRDDAAGEALDKVARASGLGYPGGQRLEEAAVGGNPETVRFPRTFFRDGSFDFSFSGVKTSALNYLRRETASRCSATGRGNVNDGAGALDGRNIGVSGIQAKIRADIDISVLPRGFLRDFFASYQAAIVDALVANTVGAERRLNSGAIVVAGGVAANGALRERFSMEERASSGRLKVFFPSRSLCTDNAAMVASRAYHDYVAGVFSPLTLNASSTAPI